MTAPKPSTVAAQAREHHEQWLARTCDDGSAFDAAVATRVIVRGDMVDLMQGKRHVARYRWRTPDTREDAPAARGRQLVFTRVSAGA